MPKLKAIKNHPSHKTEGFFIFRKKQIKTEKSFAV